MNIIGREETLLQMFPPPEALSQLTQGITRAVGESFAQQNMRNPTTQDVRTRFQICMKWAKVFRGDLRWGIQRIVGELPNALRAELMHQKYEPPQRTCWMPTDGN